MKLLLTFLLSMNLSFAEGFLGCRESNNFFEVIDETRVQVFIFKNGDCNISISPENKYPLYRNYMFSSAGELMLFNSLGEGPSSKDTGARNFFFPNKKNELSFSINKNSKEIIIKNVDGRIWRFSTLSSFITNISDMTWKEDHKVTRKNRGGLELTPKNGQIIDSGWRLGGPPNIKLKRKSVIKTNKRKCTVRNKDIYKIEYDDSGYVNGAYFAFNDELEWFSYLNLKCPHIEI